MKQEATAHKSQKLQFHEDLVRLLESQSDHFGEIATDAMGTFNRISINPNPLGPGKSLMKSLKMDAKRLNQWARICTVATSFLFPLSLQSPLLSDEAPQVQPKESSRPAKTGWPSSPRGSEPKPISDGDLVQLIDELESPVYRERQAAFLKLWELAKAEHPLLQEATQSLDPTVAASTRWLRTLIKLSASPSDAATLVEDLTLIRSGDNESMIRLARAGKWDQLLAMLELLTPDERNKVVSDNDSFIGPRYDLLNMAWNHQKDEIIPLLVDHLWSPQYAIRARKLWANQGLQSLAMIPPKNFSNDPTADRLWAVISKEISGDIEGAVQLAKLRNQPELAEEIAIQHGKWNLAIPTKFSSPPPANSVTSWSGSLQAARTALLLRWSGLDGAAQPWIDAIGLPGPTENDVQGTIIGLILNDQTERALAVAKSRLPEEAFQVLITQGRVDEALALLGLSETSPSTVKDWIDKQFKNSAGDAESEVKLTRKLAEVGSLFSRIGLKDVSKTIDQAAIQSAADLHHAGGGQNQKHERGQSPSDSRAQINRWKEIFDVWVTSHRRPLAIAQFQQLLRERIDEELRHAILKELYPWHRYPALDNLAGPLLRALYEARGEKDWGQAAEDLEEISLGKTPKNWEGDWHNEGFASIGNRILPSTAAELKDSSLPYQLATLAIELRRTDLAAQWISSSLDEPSRSAMQELLEGREPSYHPSERRFQRDPSYYRMLIVLCEMFAQQKDFSRAALTAKILLKQAPNRIDLAIQQSRWLDTVGHDEEAKEIKRRSVAMPVPTESAIAVGYELDKRKYYEDSFSVSSASLISTEKNNPNRWRLTWLASYAIRQQMDLMNQEIVNSSSNLTSKNAVSKIDEWSEKGSHHSRLHLLSRIDIFPQKIVDLRYHFVPVEMLHRFDARNAIANKDWDKADKAIRACWSVNPDQIETPIELLPLAKSAFEFNRVEPWIEMYAGPLEKHLEKWPDDTLVGNNLAWMYANLDYKLDRAYTLSKHVSELLPDDHTYLDTLAEVEFRRGNLEEALRITVRCNELAPIESHHQTQLHRFLKAISDRK